MNILDLMTIAEELANDVAFEWSIQNNSVENMQMVLRANGYDHSYETADILVSGGLSK
jgi:hypothetical protein